MKSLFILFLLSFTVLNASFTQTTVSVNVQKNSSITINGTTNLLSFRLSQSGDKLTNRNFIVTAVQTKNKIILSQNQHSILVADFTSNNKMALRDFLTLVKSNTYPAFHIQLNYFEIQSNTDNVDFSKGNVSVNLTITGKTKKYNIPINSNHEGDLYTLNGTEKIDIRDFGLVPPIEMMGLIRVNEWINIDFNIICKITSFKASPELNASNVIHSGNSDFSN